MYTMSFNMVRNLAATAILNRSPINALYYKSVLKTMDFNHRYEEQVKSNFKKARVKLIHYRAALLTDIYVLAFKNYLLRTLPIVFSDNLFHMRWVLAIGLITLEDRPASKEVLADEARKSLINCLSYTNTAIENAKDSRPTFETDPHIFYIEANYVPNTLDRRKNILFKMS